MIRYLLSGFLLCCIISCEEPDLNGSDVLPSSDQPGVYTDTLGLSVRTITEDSLIGSSISSPFFLGSMNDAAIGKTEASFYTQVRLGSSLTNGFKTSTIIDSVVLNLAYKANYGDSTSLHHVSVYELGAPMNSSKDYYTTQDFQLSDNNESIGNKTFSPNQLDSILIGDSKQPFLRIPMRKNFGIRFKEHYIRNPKTFSDNAFFITYFKGIYVTDQAAGDGSILTLNQNSTLNALIFYYRDTITDTISKSYSFLINGNCSRNNRFKHQYNSTVFDSINPSTLYIQSMAGLKTFIKFPGLMNLNASHAVSINKAELVVKLATGTSSPLINHSTLFIYAPDSLGHNTLIADVFELNGFVGGTYSDGEYKFNIARHLQRILNGKIKNYGIYLRAETNYPLNPFRTLLMGPNNIKMNLTYTLQKK